MDNCKSFEVFELTMSLNKRTGLYSVPSHHLHGAKAAPRPTFNSMDFAAEKASTPSAEVDLLSMNNKRPYS